MQVHAEDDEPMLEFEADSDPEQDNSEGRRSDDVAANVRLRLPPQIYSRGYKNRATGRNFYVTAPNKK
jgi:hypothetical protein